MSDVLPTLEEVASKLETAVQVDKGPFEAAAPELSRTGSKSEKPVEEQPAPAKEKPAVKADPLGPKFAALARREKEARQRADAAERAQADAERLRKEIEERGRAIDEREQAIKAAKRPGDVLKAHGLSYADVTADMVGNYTAPEPDPIDVKLSEKLTPIEVENKALKATLQKMEETLAAIQSDRAEQAARQVSTEITTVARENDCQMILGVGPEAVQLVQMVIQNYYNQHKKVLSYKEACDTVEEYYVAAVSRLAETPKIKSRFAPPSPAPKATKTAPASERPSALTNSLSQGVHANHKDIDKLPRHEALALLATRLQYKTD